MEPTITIIVPVYNVKKYIHRCIDSILKQTYKSLEVILIDDGSYDGSSEICDEYSKYDNRIKVIHKENSGVSSARNVGLDNAKGDFIVFVDSDDWIEFDMVELLYKNLIENDVDISICECMRVTEKASIKATIEKEDYKISKDEMLKLLLYRKTTVVWGKIFKKAVIGQTRFLENVSNNEDIYFLFQVYNNCKNIFKSVEAKYNYNVIAQNSITKKKNKKMAEDQILISNLIGEEIQNIGGEFSKEYRAFKFIVNYNSIVELIKADLIKDNLLIECRKNLKNDYFKVLKDNQIYKGIKIKALLVLIAPKIYKKMRKVIGLE